METKTNLNTLHCIFFIYQSFAFTTDGRLANSEKKIITNFMLRWSGSQKEKLNQVILETIAWGRENIKTIHDQIGVMFSMIEFLKQQPNFNIAQREYFLMDIRNIARSDNYFSQQQQEWHDMMAKALDVEIRISPQTHEEIENSLNKVKKKKIGFRRNK
ncbi:MAG: hypothetical protein CBD51_006705 [Flavobacteriales bacterium TMED191]|nr:MAG: hypothetical protein CBD51_006705 [Flavobacteriales bacterium TMED191]|tara:strand:- start:1397 stop:1873 length:477 start_codon:yes stop_codon:yes gene_type:complete